MHTLPVSPVGKLATDTQNVISKMLYAEIVVRKDTFKIIPTRKPRTKEDSKIHNMTWKDDESDVISRMPRV
jgi:hypothetical protein